MTRPAVVSAPSPRAVPLLQPAGLSPRFTLAVALAAFFGVVAARALAPSDLATRDQERVVAYVVDAATRGHWLHQDDVWGNFASKPPLFNWLAAAAVATRGAVTRFALGLPSVVCALVTALLVFWGAARLRGPRAGMLAVLLFVGSQLGLRQVFLVRSDTVFQLGVFAASLLALRAAEHGRGWWRAWVAAAGATLAKGPLGLVLVAAGAVALVRDPPPAPPGGRWRGHRIGIVLFVAITAGWLVAANVASGGRAFDKLVVDELLGHAIGTRDDFGVPGSRLSRPTLYFVTRAAPLSWFAIPAIWRALRRPSADPGTRRVTRFFAWQVLLGLALFSLASESRFVHLLPLLPAAAVLGGAELERLLAGRAFAARRGAWIAVTVVLVAGSAVYLQIDAARNDEVRRGQDALDAARALERHIVAERISGVWGARPLVHLHMGGFPRVLEDPAARSLLDAAAPVWLLVQPDAIGAAAPPHHVLWSGPFGAHAKVELWSNVARWPASPPRAAPAGWAWWAGVAALAGVALAAALRTARVVGRRPDAPRW